MIFAREHEKAEGWKNASPQAEVSKATSEFFSRDFAVHIQRPPPP